MSLIVYVAGPYRAAARFQGGSRRYAIDANVMNAGWFGALVAQAGGVPLVPHAIGYLVDDAADALPDAYWLAATLEMLRRCDALLLLPGWQDSAGSRAERDEAVRRGMPILDLDGESRQFAVVVAEWVRRIQETP